MEAAEGITTYKTVFDLIIHSAGSLFQSLLAALGNIVFIFAMIERFVPQGIEKEKEWDPRSMKPVEEPDKVSRFEQVWIILWSAVAVLLFNFYPQLLRFVFNQNGTWYSIYVPFRYLFQVCSGINHHLDAGDLPLHPPFHDGCLADRYPMVQGCPQSAQYHPAGRDHSRAADP